MNHKVSLRAARPTDEEFVNTLTRTCMYSYVAKTWSGLSEHDAYFKKNAFDLNTTQIIQLAGQDIGRLSLIVSPENILIDNIHILPTFQGRGIGAEIIKLVLERAKKENKYVHLQLLRTNPVKSLYQRLGFFVFKENKTHFFMRT